MAVTTESPSTGAVSEPVEPLTLKRRAFSIVERFSLPLAFIVVVVGFSILLPDTFATWNNALAILDQAAPLIVMASGLIVVLVMKEFDLSIGAVAGACAAVSVTLMSYHGVSSLVAILAGIGTGLLVGFANGVLVARVGIPSFIATLATGSLLAGLELAIANTTIFEGLGELYLQMTSGSVLGLPMAFVVAVVFSTILGVILRKTIFGRHASAIGDNPVAARLVGLPVDRDRIIAFTVSGGAAALAGVLLTSRAMSFYPGPGNGLMLPAYAAAFLSLSLGQGWRFNIGGTVLGVVFLGTITTGLTMLNQPPWVAAVVQGLVLLTTVMALARRQARR
jgi:ribose transport system permease protein